MQFCSEFDAALAETGPAAVFLPDRNGDLRFEPSWTRDCWGRKPGPHERGRVWMLARDRASGFVQLVFVNSSTLLVEHPRLDLRVYPDAASARAALEAYGIPPIVDEDAW